jgi:DnaJ-domain-containing protein 1
MDNKLNDLKIEKIIQEYTFLKSDEEYKKELINSNQSEFLGIINQKLSVIEPSKIKQVDNQPQPNKHKLLPKVNSETLSHNEKVKLKKIYRDIVKLTHPDKVDDEELNETYINAKNAYEQYDLFELYFISNKLNIILDLAEDD